jgi:hypothetical protein
MPYDAASRVLLPTIQSLLQSTHPLFRLFSSCALVTFAYDQSFRRDSFAFTNFEKNSPTVPHEPLWLLCMDSVIIVGVLHLWAFGYSESPPALALLRQVFVSPHSRRKTKSTSWANVFFRGEAN